MAALACRPRLPELQPDPSSDLQPPTSDLPLYTPPMKRFLIGGALLLMPVLIVAQRGGGQFPGGLNPDGSLRPSAPVGRLFSQDAYTEYSLLEPGSEAFRIRYSARDRHAPARPNWSTRRAAAARDRASRSTTRAPGQPLKFTYEPSGQRSRDPRDPRHAAAAGPRRRHRPGAHLQDLQGSADLHDERQGHRLGPQPRRDTGWASSCRKASPSSRRTSRRR